MNNVKLINNPQIIDFRGNLCFWESNRQIPFELKRLYWICDVPSGQYRGDHAFKEQKEIIIALSGSFEVQLDTGEKKHTFLLNRANKGLFVPNMSWRSLQNFSTNSVCLVLASKEYSEMDYIRNYTDFKKIIKGE